VDYIYNGCIDLLFEIVVARENHLVELIDKRHPEI